jgi:hypothetical protein
MKLYELVRKPDWEWLEESLSYDNARLPEALIAGGARTANPRMIAMGTRSLRWLNLHQLDSAGLFSPVGSDAVWGYGTEKPIYDQQPVEAWAAIDANVSAMRISDSPEWREAAEVAFRWFCGSNVRSMPVRDLVTGGCHDGLQRKGMNANQGAESTLSYLLGAAAIAEISRAASPETVSPHRIKPALRRYAEDKRVA